MGEGTGQVSLLKESGYSDKAIEYVVNRVNVGEIEKPSASVSYTGPCGDTMRVYLKVNGEQITDAKFQAIGCAGAYSAGSALMEMIKGKTLEQASGIGEAELINYLGGIPEPKIHCARLAKTTLEKTIEQYQKAKSEG
jgi:nitrogen fixation NifU-like protein